MARWGNALGGWRRQARNRRGQFGTGSGGSNRARTTRSPGSRVSPAKATRKQSQSPAMAASRKRKIYKAAAVGAAAGVVAFGAYQGRAAVRESALKKRHGDAYLPRTVPVYHYTYGNSKRKIVKSQSFVSKQRYGLPGTPTGIWFTTSLGDRPNMEISYGENILKTKVKRKHVQRHIEPFRDTKHRWLMVDAKNTGLRAGKRVSTHYAVPVSAEARSRARTVKKARTANVRKTARRNGFAA